MNHELTIERASSIFASAFAPLRCVAEPWDYDNRFRFRVFDGDEPLLSADDMLTQQVTNSRRLEAAIAHARSSLEERGYVLEPWSFPSVG
jgi:hypothetical protein